MYVKVFTVTLPTHVLMVLVLLLRYTMFCNRSATALTTHLSPDFWGPPPPTDLQQVIVAVSVLCS